jgi:hypothetical protein
VLPDPIYKGLILTFCLTLFVLVYGNGSDFFTDSFALNRDLIFTPQDKPYNKTFSDWTRDWWNWHLSIQDTKGGENNASLFHPRENYSPEKCLLNQVDGPVWYLADGKDMDDNSNPEVRECTVPKGKALLVQIVGSGCGMNEGFKNDQELLDCAVWVLPTAQLSATVDGVEVVNTNNPGDREGLYANPFKTTLTYPENNLYDLEPGTFPAMVAGHFLFVRPLPEGSHEIQFKETAIEFEGGIPGDKRLSNVKYNITVE